MNEYEMGWVDNQEWVEEVVGTLPWRNFGATQAGADTLADIPSEVLGWKHYEQLTGQKWPMLNQGSVGSCVSFGTTQALLYTMSCEIVAGDAETVRIPSMEVIYAGSRVEVGGGRMRGDGSCGAWAADWVRRWGVVPQDVYGDIDLTSYDPARAKRWGNSGCPESLESVAKINPIGATTLVTSFDDACLSLASGYGINVCSSQGFGMTRDSDGYCRTSGSWAHSMAFIGYRKGGKRPGLFVVNSWGGNSTTGPTPDDAPASGWWVDASVADSMLRGKDSFCYSKFTGFPSRKIDWRI